MKKLLALGFVLGCASSLSLFAAEGKGEKKPMTDAQKEVMKKVLACEDKDKEGKLGKEERAGGCDKCKKAMKEAGIGGGKKKA
jgi:hypothetical protein